MQNNSNRLMAGFLLLAMFGVIAVAGSRAAAKAQGTQNVLVTNTSSQQVPVVLPARPGTGAYIVSVANAPTVKVSSSAAAPVVTKDSNNSDANSAMYINSFGLAGGTTGMYGPNVTLSSSLEIIIDSVSIGGIANVGGESVDTGGIYVYSAVDANIGNFVFAFPIVIPGSQDTEATVSTHIPLPAGSKFQVYAERHGGSTNNCNVFYTIAYHTVPNP